MKSAPATRRMEPVRQRRWPVDPIVIALLALLLLLLLLGGGTARSGHATTVPTQPQTSGGRRPNIVLILTDDQRWDTLWSMPHVQHDLMDHGITYQNAFVVNSFCCPSRTSILTGEYSHGTGVYTSSAPNGGFSAFHDGSTIATWLHDAGYTTGLYGKYLNEYTGTYIPPGWDHFFAFQMGTADYYYNYAVNDDGTLRSYGTAPQDYSTDVLTSHAVDFIQQSKGPFFLYLAPYAPHLPATPAPPDVSTFSHLKPYRPPSYDEADVSDKPGWVRALPRLDAKAKAFIDQSRIDAYRSLQDVDRMVHTVVQSLASTGRLDNTMIVFMSDNGLSWGEHRWVDRKEAAWEESIRVPLVVRYDPLVTTPRTDKHLVLNIDLAPTFAEVAGVPDPGVEGRTLLPLFGWPGAPWRTDFLVEHMDWDWTPDPPTLCADRTTRFMYVEYSTGEEELYDLKRDPFELDNVAAQPEMSSIVTALRERTQELCHPPPQGLTPRDQGPMP